MYNSQHVSFVLNVYVSEAFGYQNWHLFYSMKNKIQIQNVIQESHYLFLQLLNDRID